MRDRRGPSTTPVGSLRTFLWASGLAAAGLGGAAIWRWPFTVSATSAALIVLFAVAEAHPVVVRYRGRSESIVVGEFAAALAAVSLPVAHVVWVVIGGTLLTPVADRLLATHEGFRYAPPSRHVQNAAKNVIGLSGLVLLDALVDGRGTAAELGAVGIGLFLHGIVSTLLLRGAIRRSVQVPAPSRTQALLEPLAIAAVLTVFTIPLGPLLRASSGGWRVVVVLAVALVLVSRARTGRDMAAFRLTAVTEAVAQLSVATSVADFDDRLRSVIANVLFAARVEIVDAAPSAPTRETVAARMGDDGPWIVAHKARLRAPWTPLDHGLLQAVLAAATPERNRLGLMARMAEAERFASLVLTAAGHDIANQLHVALMAVETLTARRDVLASQDRDAVLERARGALVRAGAGLQDMVAVGASGPDASASGGALALFVRRISPDVRVTATNVHVAAASQVVERAVENLVLNALRHHRGPEPLDVVVQPHGPQVAIEVRDRGPGLSSDQVETLTQPFTQLTDHRRRRGSLGLGLFIARGLAESVGGALAYQDRPGGGAVFRLLLPSADGPGERLEERVVLGPGPDRHSQAPAESWSA